jgi:light-regulated signal transduction histidine kinase (bacteriophytochrome)
VPFSRDPYDSIGIDPVRLALLFKPLQQIERDEAVGGLGLAVVRGYVEWHGGTVAAASSGLGRGCTFYHAPAPAGGTPTAGQAEALTPAMPVWWMIFRRLLT